MKPVAANAFKAEMIRWRSSRSLLLFFLAQISMKGFTTFFLIFIFLGFELGKGRGMMMIYFRSDEVVSPTILLSEKKYLKKYKKGNKREWESSCKYSTLAS